MLFSMIDDLLGDSSGVISHAISRILYEKEVPYEFHECLTRPIFCNRKCNK